MSVDVKNFISWIRSFLDDVYADIIHTHSKSDITDLEQKVFYGTCSTSASTQTKEVIVDNWSFTTGNILFVNFKYGNTYNGVATININGTNKNIATVGTTTTSRYYWKSGEMVGFIYDGTNMVMLEGGYATTSYYGVTKLENSVTSTSTSTSATPKNVKQAYDLANSKQDALVSGTNIKTINNESLLGSGNITIEGGTGSIDDTVTQNSSNPVKSSGIYSALSDKANNVHTHTIPQITNLQTNLDNKVNKTDLLDLIYPIGAIYMSVNNTNPSTLLGGTWEQLKDKFLLASGDTYSNGATGGSKDAVVVSHNHTQNAHHHAPSSANASFILGDSGANWLSSGGKGSIAASGSNHYMYTSSSSSSVGENATTSNTTATNNSSGVDGTDKNMPPYLVVNVWKRTA